MASKDSGKEVSIHLTLGDNEFATQFNKIIGGLTDELNQAGKQFAAHMENAHKAIKNSSQALEDTMSEEPRRNARPSGGGASPQGGGGTASAEQSVDRANKLINQMERRSIDAAEGAKRMGTEYREVQKVVNDLVTASEKLQQGSRVTHKLEDQNKLRKQAGKTMNQLIKKVKDLAKTEQITRDQAANMLDTLKRGAAQYSDERIRAEKAIQSVQKSSMTDFRKMLRSRITLVEALPQKHNRIRQQLEDEKNTLIQKVQANEDNVDALQRLKQVKKTISTLDKKRDQRKKAETQARIQREEQEKAGAEMAFSKELKQERKRVEEEVQQIEGTIAEAKKNQGTFKSIFGGSAAPGLERQQGELQQLLKMMDQGGEEAAKSLEKAQKRRLRLLEEEIDRYIQLRKQGDLKSDDERVMNSLMQDRLRLMKNIENTEEQIKRIQNQQTAQQRQQQGRRGTGRKARRRQMKENGSFAQYNAAMEASRLVQDAPFGLIGIVNNLDMAYESMGKLITQSDNLGKALKSLFFGATAATGMLWINMLTSAVMVLNDWVDLTGSISKRWAGVKQAIVGVEAPLERLSDKIDEVANKKLKIAGDADFSDVEEAQEELTDKITELREKANSETVKKLIPGRSFWEDRGDKSDGIMNRLVDATPFSLFTEGESVYNNNTLLGSIFGSTEFDDEIDKLTKLRDKVDKAVADGMGMKKAFKNAKNIGPLVVEQHQKTLDAISELDSREAEMALRGRDGEEAIPFEKDKIKAKYKEDIAELESELQDANFEYSMASAAGDDEAALEAALAADQEAQRLENLIEMAKRARQRELDNVGEDEKSSQSTAAADILEIQQERRRKAIELQGESLKKKKMLINEERKTKIESLNRELEEFEGTKAQEAEFAEEIDKRKDQARSEARKAREEAERKHNKKIRETRRKTAKLELKLQKRQTELNSTGDSAEIERSRIKMEKKRLDLKEKVRQAELNGNMERADDLRRLRDMQSDFHDQRVAEIRKESRENQKKQSKKIQGLIRESNRYEDSLERQGQGGETRDQIRSRIESERRQAVSDLRRQFQDRMQKVNEANDQSDTIESEMRAFQQRLSLYKWFLGQKENLLTDYQNKEKTQIKQHNRSLAQGIGGQLSSRLGDISSALDSLQRAFVQKRKQALIEQGMAEEKAADKAEKEGKRRFAIKKKIAIAEGVVNTFNAALNSFNQASSIGGLPAGLAAAATALTYGFAQVAKIRAQSIGSGSGNSSGGGVSVSGLDSSTSAGKSQVTDRSSSFASKGGGMDKGDLRDQKRNLEAKEEVSKLREDMSGYTDEVKNMEPEAKMSEETAIEAGEAHSDHKKEDRY